jgi:hypothetical protein
VWAHAFFSMLSALVACMLSRLLGWLRHTAFVMLCSFEHRLGAARAPGFKQVYADLCRAQELVLHSFYVYAS